LVDDDVVQKRRGLGMFLKDGACARLLDIERSRFRAEEWPVFKTKLDRLGLSLDDLKT